MFKCYCIQYTTMQLGRATNVVSVVGVQTAETLPVPHEGGKEGVKKEGVRGGQRGKCLNKLI